jgi:hypothetical protein
MIRLFACALLCALTTEAWAAGPTLQDRQQAACYDDVMRLCADAVPDVDRVTACMKDKRKLVSAPCAAFYPKKGQ